MGIGAKRVAGMLLKEECDTDKKAIL